MRTRTPRRTLSHGEVRYYNQVINMVPPASPRYRAVLLASNSTSTDDSRPDSAVPAEHVEGAKDDAMVRDQPLRYIDYLSHDWKEEDIWSSWKHIVSKRNAYGNSARLENASWRTWTKSRYRLKTVPPEALNWLKDCDVTWLYGPLQASSDELSMTPISLAGVGISNVDSSPNKKPILKKRGALETMLQLSLSVPSPPNPATVQTPRGNATFPPQKADTPSMGRPASGCITSPFSSRLLRRDDGYEIPSVASSGEQSPATNEMKHIHFSDKVEQWIAVDFVDGGDDEDGIGSCAIDDDDDDDSSSDDGFLMMKGSSRPKALNRSSRSNPQTSFGAESSTIAILPSTTLNYREDAPKLTKPTTKQGGGRPLLSLSQETSKVLGLSTKILLNNYDQNADVSWKLSSVFANHKDSSSTSHDTLQLNASRENNRGEAHDDLRPTLFGQVVDAVNTAKDIAYVIWNVGW
ncbi:hypothetical protein B0J14DRAFT_619996 [Halenospora varia]|nr:hypothetical protein B0J14DRAFT_619996 [Halenospora varia]